MRNKNGQQWTRVTGMNLDVNKVLRTERNAGVLASKGFLDACAKVGIEPSLRQASKFARKRGVAYHGVKYQAPTAKRGW